MVFKKIFSILKNNFNNYTNIVIVGFLSLVLVTLLNITKPLVTKNIFDNGLILGSSKIILIKWVVFFFLIVLLTNLFSYIRQYTMRILTRKIILDKETSILKKIQFTKAKFLSNYSRGGIISHLTKDLSIYTNLFFPTISRVIINLFMLISSLVIIFMINYKLSVIVGLLFPIFIFIMVSMNKKVKKYNRDYLKRREEKLGKISEGLKLTELFNDLSRPIYNIRRIFSINKKYFKSAFKKDKYELLYRILLIFFSQVIPVVIYLYGGILYIEGELTIGSLLAFISYIGYVFAPSIGLVDFNLKMQKSISAYRRLKKLSTLPKIKNSGIKIEKINLIVFNDIDFRYNKNKEIFKNVNIKFTKNNIIGIIGSSGIGKTTLLKLILGKVSHIKGSIRINNYNIKD